MKEKYYIGIDCGSVNMKLVVLDHKFHILWSTYQKIKGDFSFKLNEVINQMLSASELAHIQSFDGIYTTGIGRFVIAEKLNGFPVNEISSHAMAGGYYYPETKTIIEIGGQGSKLILLEKEDNGLPSIYDSQINQVCAAGTGSFLEQHALWLGISLEEMSKYAMISDNPVKISGKCSVFVKADMIHLQQAGAAKEDIAYGLCLEAARNFSEDLIKGRLLKKPILFQGGAANKGIKRAFTKILQCSEKEIIIPEYFNLMGAIGAVIYGVKKKYYIPATRREIKTRSKRTGTRKEIKSMLSPLSKEDILYCTQMSRKQFSDREVFLGIDIGSVSVKLAALNQSGELIFKYYYNNYLNPLEAVNESLEIFQQRFDNETIVKGVGVTGSRRQCVEKYINADIVKNEITAQAAGTVCFVDDADVIIEIGGHEAKFIRLKNKQVKDFRMNKACAAGTGSFLAEQADWLDIEIDEFSELAFSSESPINFGTRCTVFMESDLIQYNQDGISKEDIVAGLSYSIAQNYLEKIAVAKDFSGKVVIQGGIAYNESVVSAFSKLLGKRVIIVPHHEVTGAIGIATIAMNTLKKRKHSFLKKTVTEVVSGKYDTSENNLRRKVVNFFIPG